MATTFVFPCLQLVEVDLRFGELDAPVLGFLGFVEQLGNVQKRFGGDAASVEANAAWMGFRIDQCDIQSQVRGLKGGDVATRTATDDR